MKIYFTASISQMTPQSKSSYTTIVNALESMGHKVISEHVLSKSPDTLQNQSEEESIATQRKLTTWKKQADLVIAEVSSPSLGIGQEIAQSLSVNKPVIALYNQSSPKPHILKDEAGDLMLVISYTEKTLRSVLSDALDYASEQQDTRFNFFISSRIGNYLDWVSKKRRLPRAVYLRRLIEEDMKRNKDYEG